MMWKIPLNKIFNICNQISKTYSMSRKQISIVLRELHDEFYDYGYSDPSKIKIVNYNDNFECPPKIKGQTSSEQEISLKDSTLFKSQISQNIEDNHPVEIDFNQRYQNVNTKDRLMILEKVIPFLEPLEYCKLLRLSKHTYPKVKNYITSFTLINFKIDDTVRSKLYLSIINKVTIIHSIIYSNILSIILFYRQNNF